MFFLCCQEKICGIYIPPSFGLLWRASRTCLCPVAALVRQCVVAGFHPQPHIITQSFTFVHLWDDLISPAALVWICWSQLSFLISSIFKGQLRSKTSEKYMGAYGNYLFRLVEAIFPLSNETCGCQNNLRTTLIYNPHIWLHLDDGWATRIHPVSKFCCKTQLQSMIPITATGL